MSSSVIPTPTSATPSANSAAIEQPVAEPTTSQGCAPKTQLLEAVTTGNVEEVQSLLASGADLSVRDDEGRTALFLAVELGQRGIAKALMNTGADVNLANVEGQTPLMRAAAACDAKLVRWLIKAGAAVNAMSAEGDTALILAAGATQWVAVTEAAPGATQGIVRQTPEGPMQLCPLPQGRIVSTLSRLLKHGADPNLENCSATALMEAARYGQGDVIQFLLKSGADPAVTASDGETALDIAKIYNQTEAIALLQTAIADAS